MFLWIHFEGPKLRTIQPKDEGAATREQGSKAEERTGHKSGASSKVDLSGATVEELQAELSRRQQELAEAGR